MTRFRAAAVWMAMGMIALAATFAIAQTPKSGGHLNVMLREDLPQGFAVHETATVSTSFPSMPCFNNLVIFDQLKRTESVETLVGELAEKWSWQDNYRNLVFFLRKNVKWHDGHLFTSKDVKFTFDMLREAPEAQAKLRINPRKDWYANVEAVEAADPHTVVFRLKRPQPSLLMMFASGYTPIYAAHVPPASYRTGCIGTGPFKVKEWRKGEYADYVKNPDYFVKGRPYLDSLRYVVIENRGTRISALQAGKLDIAFPGETSKTASEQLKKAVPQLVVTPVGQMVTDNIIMNVKKPPFDNVKVRLAVSHAIDRRGLIQAVHQGGAVVGASLAPKPWGIWGIAEQGLQALPGYGKLADEKATAKKMMAELGYTQAGGDGPVASHGDPRRLPDRRQPDGPGRGRPRRQLLRELRLRLAAQLQPVLQRSRDEDDRTAVAGAPSAEAARDGPGAAEEARRGGAATHPRLASRLLHGVAARPQHDSAQRHLQLRPHAGRVARQVAQGT